MTIKECYELFGGNYDEALERLQMDKLIEKFMLKFLDDQSMQMLIEAVEDKDIEKSFRSVHTLKGVAANLAFTSLYKVSSDLAEQLRPLKEEADSSLYEKVKEQYEITVKAINKFKNDM